MESEIAALAKAMVFSDPRILTVGLNSSVNVTVGFVLPRWQGFRQTLDEGCWIAALVLHDWGAVTDRWKEMRSTLRQMYLTLSIQLEYKAP